MMSFNHQRAVEAARLLDIPFMCVHTPADNLVNDYLQRYIDDRNPCYLEELLEVLLEIPEYHEAKRLKAVRNWWWETRKTGRPGSSGYDKWHFRIGGYV